MLVKFPTNRHLRPAHPLNYWSRRNFEQPPSLARNRMGRVEVCLSGGGKGCKVNSGFPGQKESITRTGSP